MTIKLIRMTVERELVNCSLPAKSQVSPLPGVGRPTGALSKSVFTPMLEYRFRLCTLIQWIYV